MAVLVEEVAVVVVAGVWVKKEKVPDVDAGAGTETGAGAEAAALGATPLATGFAHSEWSTSSQPLLQSGQFSSAHTNSTPGLNVNKHTTRANNTDT